MRSLIAVAATIFVSCSSAPAPHAGKKEAAAAVPEVKITQFYAEPVVAKGEKTNLCYGVENAKTVTLDPPVERVWPAMARCFPVDPGKASLYTLKAEDASGRSVSQTVEIRVGPARAKIIEVSVNKLEIKAGEEVTLCYKAANAVSVDVSPGRFMTAKGNDKGCLTDKPSKTTTYRVNIAGAGGTTDSEQVTVTVH